MESFHADVELHISIIEFQSDGQAQDTSLVIHPGRPSIKGKLDTSLSNIESSKMETINLLRLYDSPSAKQQSEEAGNGIKNIMGLQQETEKMALREINKLIAKDLKKKLTIQDLEEQAEMVLERGDLTEESKQFYKGFLRAFEILRKYGFIKER